MTFPIRKPIFVMVAIVLMSLEHGVCLAQVQQQPPVSTGNQQQETFFPNQSQYIDPRTGQPAVSPNTRQLTDPATGRSQFTGYSRQLTDPKTGASTFTGYTRKLTDPVTGNSTFTGYTLKLTDPVTGRSTFKGYGQDPVMKDRTSAPDFHWTSSVNEKGRSMYSGFGRQSLVGTDGRPTFIGNTRSLADPQGKKDFVDNYRSFQRADGVVDQTPGANPESETVPLPNMQYVDKQVEEAQQAQAQQMQQRQEQQNQAQQQPGAGVPVQKPDESGF